MQAINNPILKGFNPDPSIIRVGDDYYIATSTFEWFPGVQIHHSTDLKNWQLTGHPLTKTSQLDMRGVPDSCGVWAPCLSYHDGVFYLLYSNVRSFNGQWKDTPNYLVTATDINGPWSEPVFVNASGFDASLFHDDDGRSYCLNMLLDHRNGKFFGGIIMQEFCRERLCLVDKPHYIFTGTELGCTEGPHIYKRNGYYYLLTAEGGTGYQHAVTLARSKNIYGPYDLHPNNPILTANHHPDAYLQKTGHADLVQTANGYWYMVFLASRPLSRLGRCTLGRETAITQVEWREDNWLYLVDELSQPTKPALTNGQTNAVKTYLFSQDDIDINFQALRVPITADWANTKNNPGHLRLYGRDSLSSCFEQSLLGHRVQAHKSIAETCVQFNPNNFQQMAGLVCYYNTSHYYYLHIYGDDYAPLDLTTAVAEVKSTRGKKYLTIIRCDNHKTSQVCQPIDISGHEQIYLKAELIGAELQFNYALALDKWQKIGPILDGSILSDDYVVHLETGYQPCFTGAFYAMACQDLSGNNLFADFAYFKYTEISE